MALDENDVATAVCLWLEDQGYATNRITAGQRGFDVTAIHSRTGEQWVIEAKGATSSRKGSAGFGKVYGSGSSFQAVASAFLTATSWIDRKEMAGKRLGIALPSTYWFNVHSEKIEAACSKLGVSIFRVQDDRGVTFIEASAEQIAEG